VLSCAYMSLLSAIPPFFLSSQDAQVLAGDQDLTPMDKSLEAMRAAAKAKGLYVE